MGIPGSLGVALGNRNGENVDVLDGSVAVEGVFRDTGHGGTIFRTDIDGLQLRAILKGLFVDLFHGSGNGNARHHLAMFERIPADTCQALRQDEIRETATIEGSPARTLHGSRESDAGQVRLQRAHVVREGVARIDAVFSKDQRGEPLGRRPRGKTAFGQRGACAGWDVKRAACP